MNSTVERGKPCWVVFEHANQLFDCSGTLVDEDRRWLTLRDDGELYDVPKSHLVRMEQLNA